MTVNYSELIKADFALKVGDEFLIHGFKYKVVKSDSKFWLENTKGSSNADVFIKLGRNEDRMKWANEYDNTISPSCPYAFPEFSSLEKLTSFVRAIYETPGYKVGTKVRVKKRVGLAKEYPFDFVDSMTDYEGKICTINSFAIGALSIFENCKYYDGDIHEYKFEENSYLWSSSMFEPVNAPEGVKKEISEKSEEITYTWDVKLPKYKVGDKVKILPFKEGERYPFGYFDQMAKKAGGVYEIKSVDNSSRDTGYSLKDIGFVWSENQLELMSETEKSTSRSDTGIVRLPEIKENPMGEITYTDLKKGRVLSLGDKLSICGIGYTVAINSRENRYYLMGLKYCHNDAIFSKIGRLDDKFEWARRFDASVKDDGVFPELENLEKLTKFVIDIFEEARRKEASLATDRDFGPKVGVIPKGTSVVNVLSDEPKELISILPKKIKTYIIL